MRRLNGWHAFATLAAAGAGLLFATSATTAQGTDLRSGRRLRLTELIREQERRVAGLSDEAAALRADVEAATAVAGARDARVSRAEAAAHRLDGTVGLSPVSGPGVVVSLDDAPRYDADDPRVNDASPDDLVVHEQDVLAVINALWSGGAEAVSVMGDRIIATSSVRCVGNTLLLHGRVYSPPFVVRAVGDTRTLVAALDAAPGVRYFRRFVTAYGLGFDVDVRDRLEIAGYKGPLPDLLSTRRS